MGADRPEGSGCLQLGRGQLLRGSHRALAQRWAATVSAGALVRAVPRPRGPCPDPLPRRSRRPALRWGTERGGPALGGGPARSQHGSPGALGPQAKVGTDSANRGGAVRLRAAPGFPGEGSGQDAGATQGHGDPCRPAAEPVWAPPRLSRRWKTVGQLADAGHAGVRVAARSWLSGRPGDGRRGQDTAGPGHREGLLLPQPAPPRDSPGALSISLLTCQKIGDEKCPNDH